MTIATAASEGTAPDSIVLILAKDLDDESNVLEVQDFIIDGESVIPIFSSIEAFKAQSVGSGFENKAIEIKLEFYLSVLKGHEVFILNPGGSQPKRLTVSELINWGKSE